MFLLINTTSAPLLPVYVPTATLIASPVTALPIAPLIVKQGDVDREQEFESLPEGDAYNIKLLFSRWNSTDGSPLAEAITT